MTEFKTDISENGKKFELVFQTDNKAYFEKMQARARECIDHKPVTQFDRIKAMSVEEMADLLDSFRQCSNCRRNGNNCFPTFRTEQWLEQEISE